MAAPPYEELTVGEIMSASPISVRAGNTLADLRAYLEAEDIRHLPVIDAERRVIGILSNRDVLRASGRPAKTTTARDLMTEDVLCVTAKTRAREASALMLDHKIGAVPIVDDADRLIGIVTETDFLRIAHWACGGELLAVDDD